MVSREKPCSSPAVLAKSTAGGDMSTAKPQWCGPQFTNGLYMAEKLMNIEAAALRYG